VNLGSLTVTGKLGDREIAKSYDVGAERRSEDSFTVHAAGQGMNAGVVQPAIVGGILVEGWQSNDPTR
jgi:hypothetical protein